MEMSTSRAGAVAVAAGLLLAALDLGRLPILLADDRVTALLDPVNRAVNAAYFFGLCGLVFAVIALHSHHRTDAGAFGTVGFAAAVLGTVTMAGDMWFDGFAAPWLADVAPQVFTVGATPILQVGAVLSYGLCALGWVLFGASMARGRRYPRAIALLVAVGGVLSWRAGVPPYGAALGLAVAAAGAWLVRSSGEVPVSAPARAPAPRPPSG
ncbi:hypothetical protein ACQEVB_37895 [Pseudonocardia sp. CA-107938]|uniref:hypothetical protein n=1 Tax=Pseudonocardia sp. CA-107938 TaxID=3240021 RepID=UPI003D8E50A8